MKLFLLLFFVVAAGCACALLLAVLRARDRRLLVAAARTAYSDAPDGIGISVLCSGVTDPAQLENLLSPEYSRYEVVVVLDSRRQAAEFGALVARYRMIRVEWTFAGELEVTGVRALGRSRKRCFRRLVLVDRVFDGAAGDLDAAARRGHLRLPASRRQGAMPASRDRRTPRRGTGLRTARIARPSRASRSGRTRRAPEPRGAGRRGRLRDAGLCGGLPRSRRRTLWEPLLAPSEARRSLPRRWLFLPALLLATAFGLSVAAGRWTAAAAVVTAALVWAAAACVSRAVSGEAWSGLRRFIPIRRIFRYY